MESSLKDASNCRRDALPHSLTGESVAMYMVAGVEGVFFLYSADIANCQTFAKF